MPGWHDECSEPRTVMVFASTLGHAGAIACGKRLVASPTGDSMPRAILRVGIACLLLMGVSAAHADDDAAPDPSNAGSSGWPLVEVSVPRVTGLPALETRSVNAWLHTSCVPPCALRLNPLQEYRISGEGVVDSDPFRLPLGVDRVRVDVSAGSTLVRDLGTAFTIGGLLFAAGGGTVLLLPQDDHASSDAKTDKTIVGVGFLTIGVLTAALGMALRFASDTSVQIRSGDFEHSTTVGTR
jgi:hypothetical protein